MLYNRNLFSHGSGGQKSEIKVSRGHTPSTGSRGGAIPFLFQLQEAPSIHWLESALTTQPSPLGVCSLCQSPNALCLS